MQFLALRQCLPHNKVALLYTLPTLYSTPTTSRSDFVFVAFLVYDRSGISVSMGSSWALSPGCCAPVHQLLVHHKLTNLLMAILVHLLKSKHDGSG